MRPVSLLFPALAFLPYATAQGSAWGQCGGYSWGGSPECVSGVKCFYLGPYYSQCVPECKPANTTTEPGSTVAPTSTVTTNAARSVLQTRDSKASTIGIVALDGWATNKYLSRSYSSSDAVLGYPSYSTPYDLSQPGAIRLIDWVKSQPQCIAYPYLNIKSAETSYKPLVFEDAPITLDWSFDGPDSTLTTTSGSNTFVACQDGRLYYQTGTDLPNADCTTTRLVVGSIA